MRAASEPDMNRHARFKFRLYVADNSHNSVRAMANLTALCQAHLPDRHTIEIVDVFKEPNRALAEGALMTPLLIKLAPFPVTRIVGTLSHSQTVLEALGLETHGTDGSLPASRALKLESDAE